MANFNFYDKNGSPIAYSDDGEHVFTYSGKPVAYLYNDSVYSFKGKHLGWFEKGWIIDNNGYCVLYSENAKGGPVSPVRKNTPPKGSKKIKPAKSPRSNRPPKPSKKPGWSKLSGENYFDQ